ncbi:NlpC/P60 family protein [Dactylosporangium sp. NBC_01737]|uniref:C40 family peptidase n=1 Tax=Dactylosporangium sp. NBC_01737 TaxID=2975959 RepID=UPI002E1659A7|nr:NlpC/P60 family protein [Dactylosporangium sp. NBC_01737]
MTAGNHIVRFSPGTSGPGRLPQRKASPRHAREHRADRGVILNARQPLHRIAAGTTALALTAVWLGPSAAAAQPAPNESLDPAVTLAAQEAQLAGYERADKAYRTIRLTARTAPSVPDADTRPAVAVPGTSKPATTKKPAPKKTTGSSGSTTTVKPPSGAAGTVVSFALAQVGKGYVYATSGPNTYDCSGLVAAAYARVGIKLPHQSEQIAARGRRVPSGQWMPGDVIHTSGHVAIYIGGGKMVEAANPSSGVRVAPVRGGTAYRFL